MEAEEERAIERACSRLVTRYCHLIDQGAASQIGELFSESGIWSSAEKTLIGRDAIGRSFAQREADAGRMSRHVCSTSMIDVETADAARGLTYLTLYRQDGPVGRNVSRVRGPRLVGEYRDRFVRTPAGWRIGHREVVVAFVAEDTAR